jgi:hypothetical protein
MLLHRFPSRLRFTFSLLFTTPALRNAHTQIHRNLLLCNLALRGKLYVPVLTTPALRNAHIQIHRNLLPGNLGLRGKLHVPVVRLP